MTGQTGSYWVATASAPDFPALAGDLDVDVAIIGGGLVGVIAARLLKDAGRTVALVEARKVGQEVTGKSTAKITSQHNIKYTKLRSRYGTDAAGAYGQAAEAGLRCILDLAARHGIDADIEEMPAFTYTLDDDHAGEIEEEVALARDLGLPATLTAETGLPFPVRVAMRWDGQAQFHPVKFVAGLAATITGDGCRLFEQSRALDWDTDRVETGGGRIKAGRVIMATHLPLGQVGLFHAENSPHAHVVMAGRADPARVPPGMYINVEQPRHSVRSHRGADGEPWLVFTGPGFRPGHIDDERGSFAEIERFARDAFGVAPEYRWVNEDYTPADGVPFIGWSARLMPAYLVATGFDAWGIATGAAAAMMLTDLVEGRDNPWIGLFDASRLDLLRGGAQMAANAAKITTHLARGYLSRKPTSAEDLAPGEAAILKLDGRNIAAYRDSDGILHQLSAVCSHMGCILGWNETDQSWDCPCHGSRFDLSGQVIHGPATQPLGSRVTG